MRLLPDSPLKSGSNLMINRLAAPRAADLASG
jgi:hypothetical protein